jgi:HAD superfamily hydrolase (TIGR01509 family)
MAIIKTVVFDLYGVLFFLKSSLILRKIGVFNTLKFLSRYGITPYRMYYVILDKMRLEMPGEFQEKIAYRGIFLPYSFCEWQRGKLLGKEVFDKIITFIYTLNDQKYFKHSDDAALIQGFFTQAFDSKGRVSAMYVNKKLLNFIHTLKNNSRYNVLMLTNIDHELLALLQNAHQNVFDLFDDVIASCKIELVKPQQEIFNYLLQEHNLNAQETIFFDDQQENIDAAKKVGIEAVLYKKGMDLNSLLRKTSN